MTVSDTRPSVPKETPKVTTEQQAAAVRLCIAADRMRDDWAESDKAVRAQLWLDLHTAADDFRDGRSTDQMWAAVSS